MTSSSFWEGDWKQVGMTMGKESKLAGHHSSGAIGESVGRREPDFLASGDNEQREQFQKGLSLDHMWE